jgi:hypothetical protein
MSVIPSLARACACSFCDGVAAHLLKLEAVWADKLAAIAAAAVGKLAYGGSASPAAGAASDLAKFRKDSVARLKRDISE